MTLTLREPFVPAWFQTLIWITETLPKESVFTLFIYFFYYFFSLKHFLCLYLGPMHSFEGDQYITLPESQKLLPLISTLQTASLLVSSPLTDSSVCRGGWIGSFIYYEEKEITGHIAYVGGQKHPLHKAWYLAYSLSLWKSNAHSQIGKICAFWRNNPAQFQVLRAPGMAPLKLAHTGCMSLLCPIGLACPLSWSNWLHVQMLSLE